ncbi:MAG: hypothetical protein JOZ38_04460, partial [Candidatus Eremiobacteraeota bacterium]|nr:hypothetical protein [Candidatus Eremiobacteraeota bacterium]
MARIFFALLAAGAVWMLPAAAADEFAASPANEANPMTVVLDARQAPRGLMYVRMTIPARPGPFTLVYPKWIPGEHGPTGPLRVLSQLRVSAGGHALAWQRDQVDLYAFHLTVPSGVSQIDVEFTGIINAPEDVMATKNVAIVNWNRYILYQADTHNTDVFAKPSVILPAGWKYGTALPDPRQNGDRVDFGTVSLETLVDSPLDMGRYSKRIDQWSNGSASAQIDIFADKPQDLNIDAKVVKEYKNYAAEGIALYGARHWNYYHALLTLS